MNTSEKVGKVLAGFFMLIVVYLVLLLLYIVTKAAMSL